MTIKTWQELKALSNNQWSDDECMKEEISQLWVALVELDKNNATCPTCGEDGGTSCGAVNCGLLEAPEPDCYCDELMAAAKLALNALVDLSGVTMSKARYLNVLRVIEALRQAGVQ